MYGVLVNTVPHPTVEKDQIDGLEVRNESASRNKEDRWSLHEKYEV